MKKREIGQVSFNMTDDFERGLWEHAVKKGFSKYVKRLIDRDMNNTPIPMSTTIEVEVHKEMDEDKEAAKGFL